jgi:hypothetical protein
MPYASFQVEIQNVELQAVWSALHLTLLSELVVGVLGFRIGSLLLAKRRKEQEPVDPSE